MRTKQSKIFLFISIILLSLVVVSGIVFGFYTYFESIRGSELIISKVNFSVNGKTEKNNIITTPINLALPDERGAVLTEKDGYVLTFDYKTEGEATFTFNYAIKYDMYLHATCSNASVIDAIEVYEYVYDSYKYKCMLSEILSKEVNGVQENVTAYTGFLGVGGTNTYRIMLVYSPGAKDEFFANEYFDLTASVTSNVALTTVDNFPYYYVKSYEGQSMYDVVSALAVSTNSASSTIEGRTIVLLEDLTLESNLTFNKKVGFDLNGHYIDFNGYTITINDTNTSGTNEIFEDVRITDSQATIENPIDLRNGSDNGTPITTFVTKPFIVDLDDSVMKVDLGLAPYVNTTSYLLSVLRNHIQELLDSYTDKQYFSTNASFVIDLFGENDYRYLLGSTSPEIIQKVTISDNISTGLLNETFTITNGVLTISGITQVDKIYLSLALGVYGGAVEPYIINSSLIIHGNTISDLESYLEEYVPSRITGSIFLPRYLEQFDAYITWISDNDNLLNNQGKYLANGYRSFTKWDEEVTKLGYIIEKDGKSYSGTTIDITVEILSDLERANMLFNNSSVIFNNESISSYAFDITSQVIKKYEGNIPDNELNEVLEENLPLVKLQYIALSIFNIDLSTFSNYESASNDFITKVLSKLCITNVIFDDNLTNEHTSYLSYNNLTQVMQQLSVPNRQISFTTDTNYMFESLNTITLNNVIVILDSIAQTSMVDLSNTIRVPFDIYTDEQRTLTDGLYPRYEEYAFDLVQEYDGEPITYTVQGDALDYVSIRDYKVYINKSLIPNTTTTVEISASISNQVFHPTFELIGIYHNDDDDIADPSLYVELIANYDLNRDGILTVLEANSEVSSITINNKNIKSLKGIEYFNQITSLDLAHNGIEDIDILSELSNLTSLNLSYNAIRSLEGIRYSSKITNLNLSNNQITNLSPIQYLTQITNLNVSNNFIYDFSYLNDFVNLDVLKVYNNYITTGVSSVIGTDNPTIINTNYYTMCLAKNVGCDVYRTYDGTTEEIQTFDAITLDATTALMNIVPTYEAKNILILPLSVNGDRYTYLINSEDASYINFTRVSSEVTKVEINQNSVVDKIVTIYAMVKLSGETTYSDSVYRAINIRIMPNSILPGQKATIEVYDTENNTYSFIDADVAIPDMNLRSILFEKFNTNKNRTTGTTYTGYNSTSRTIDSTHSDAATIYYDELVQAKNTLLDLSYSNITSIEGLNYFTGITELDLTGNVLTYDQNSIYNANHDKDRSTNEVSLEDLSTLTNLHTLTLSGQRYEYHSLENLTNLNTLNVYGCYGLQEEELQTQLYHIFLNNLNNDNANNMSIYVTSASDKWDPYQEQLAKFVRSLPSTAVFLDKGDVANIPISSSFYFYDDIDETIFTLTIPNDISGYNYYNTNGMKINFKDYFTINDVTIDNVLYKQIAYSKLNGYTNTAYVNLTLTSSESSNERLISTDISYPMALRMEFNYKYRFNNKPLNQSIASKEALLIVMEAISNSSSIINYEVTQNFLNSISTTSINLLGIYDPSLSSVTDGLQYLPSITTVTCRRDFTFGDGSSLVNVENLVLSYSGIDLSTLTNELTNLTKLSAEGIYYLTFGEYDVSSNGPGSLIDSYFKYLPNLEELSITKSPNTKLYNFSPLLAYAYMPVGTVDVAYNELYAYDEYSNTMTVSNEGSFIKMPKHNLKTITFSGFHSENGLEYKSLDNILTLVADNIDSEQTVSYKINDANYTPTTSQPVTPKYSYNVNEEKNEFSKYVADLGLKVNNSYYRDSTTHVYNAFPTVTLPANTEEFVYNNTYRAFPITWYVITQNGNTLSKTQITSSTYVPDSYYCVLEGVISDSSSTYSTIYPITVVNNSTPVKSIARITDKNLRLLAFINNLGGNVTTLSITFDNMFTNVSSIFASNTSLVRYLSPILSIEGIERFPLTSLIINNQYISDISPLWNSDTSCLTRTSLVALDLTDNIVSSISGFNDLTNLTSLTLDKNNVLDIGYLGTGKTLTLKLNESLGFTADVLTSFIINTTNANNNLSTITLPTQNVTNKITTLNLEINGSGMFNGLNALSLEGLNALKALSYICTNVTIKYNSTTNITLNDINALLDLQTHIVSNDTTSETTILSNHIKYVNGNTVTPTNASGVSNFGEINTYTVTAETYNPIILEMIQTDIRIKCTISKNDLSFSTYKDVIITTGNLTTNRGIRVYSDASTYVNYDFDDFDPQFANYIYDHISDYPQVENSNWRSFNSSSSINKALTINVNYNITSLKGFDKLLCSSISITNNPICKLEFTDNITTLTSFSVESTAFLTDITGLSKITNRSSITITLSDCNTNLLSYSPEIISDSFNKDNLTFTNYNLLQQSLFDSYSDLDDAISNYLMGITNTENWFECRTNSNKAPFGNHNAKTSAHIVQKRLKDDTGFNESNFGYDSYSGEMNTTIGAILSDTKTSNSSRTNLTSTPTINVYIASNDVDITLNTGASILGKNFSLSYTNVSSGSHFITYSEINGNVLTIKKGITSGTYTIVCNTSYDGVSSSFDITVIVNSDDTSNEQLRSIESYFVELPNGTIVPASEVFDSTRLIYEIFDYSQKHSEGTNNSIYGSDSSKYIPLESDTQDPNKKIMRQSAIMEVTRIHLYNVGVNSLKGIEIFVNLKELVIGRDVSDSSKGVGLSGIDFTSLQNMKLTRFEDFQLLNAALLTDYSFLYNSRETLTTIRLGSNMTLFSDTNPPLDQSPQNFDDLSFLMSFPNLTSVNLYGLSGYETTTSFQYFLTWMYINREDGSENHLDVRYNGAIIDPPSDVKKATTIFSFLSLNDDSSFEYINDFELYLKNEQSITNGTYYLPAYYVLNSKYYKLNWYTTSSYVTVNLKNITDNTTLSIDDFNTGYVNCFINNSNVMTYLQNYKYEIVINNAFDNFSKKALIDLKMEVGSTYSVLDDNGTPVNRYNAYYYDRTLTINFSYNNAYPQILFRDGSGVVKLDSSFNAGTTGDLFTFDSNVFDYNVSTRTLRIKNPSATTPQFITDKDGNEYSVYWSKEASNIQRINDIINVNNYFNNTDNTALNNLSASLVSLEQSFDYYDIWYLDSDVVYDNLQTYLYPLNAFNNYVKNYARGSVYTTVYNAYLSYLNSNSQTPKTGAGFIDSLNALLNQNNTHIIEFTVENTIYPFIVSTNVSSIDIINLSTNYSSHGFLTNGTSLFMSTNTADYIGHVSTQSVNPRNGNSQTPVIFDEIKYQYNLNNTNVNSPITKAAFATRFIDSNTSYQYHKLSDNTAVTININTNIFDIVLDSIINQDNTITIYVNNAVIEAVRYKLHVVRPGQTEVVYDILSLTDWYNREKNASWVSTMNNASDGSGIEQLNLEREFLLVSGKGYLGQSMTASDIMLVPYVTLTGGYSFYITDNNIVGTNKEISNTRQTINSNFTTMFSANLYFDLNNTLLFTSYYYRDSGFNKISFYNNVDTTISYTQIQFFSINLNTTVAGYNAGGITKTSNRIYYSTVMLFNSTDRVYRFSFKQSDDKNRVNVCMSAQFYTLSGCTKTHVQIKSDGNNIMANTRYIPYATSYSRIDGTDLERNTSDSRITIQCYPWGKRGTSYIFVELV